MSYPSAVPLAALNATREAWSMRNSMWDDLETLTKTGAEIKALAGRFLRKRQKEPGDLYGARLEAFTYQNIFGSIVGWYVSKLFEKPTKIEFRNGAAAVVENDGLVTYVAKCDRVNSFSSQIGAIARGLLKFGEMWVLTDLPASKPEQFASLADQRAAGALQPFNVVYDPRSVMDCSYDDAGNLAWVRIKTIVSRSDDAISKPKRYARWAIYDCTEYAIYESEIVDKPTSSQDKQVANLVATGRHALADAGRVPVRRIAISDELYIGGRVYLPTLAHINTENGFSWALHMGNLAVPVVKGGWKEPIGAVSESNLIQLDEAGDFGWSEPKGTTFEHSAKRLDSLREEIYRQAYCQAQGRSSQATASVQSGYSKELDMAPADDVLTSYGLTLRESGEAILQDVLDAMAIADTHGVISGLDFSADDAESDVALAGEVLALNIDSPTLEKEMEKRAARAAVGDVSPETLAKIEGEIMASPIRIDRARAKQTEWDQAIGARFAAAASRNTA